MQWFQVAVASSGITKPRIVANAQVKSGCEPYCVQMFVYALYVCSTFVLVFARITIRLYMRKLHVYACAFCVCSHLLVRICFRTVPATGYTTNKGQPAEIML